MIPDFTTVAWSEPKAREAKCVRDHWLTPEGIRVKRIYSQGDLKDLPFLDTYPGAPPFIRGPYPTMYVQQPWTIRQYAGFSTAEESNAFYRRNLAAGQKGLSVAFDLATHRGYDSDHPRVTGDVGMAGVAIDSILDMRQLFDSIPLGEMTVSMTMNGAVLPILALYVVAGEEQGVAQKDLAGTIQNDILKEFMVRNTYIYPPKPSMRITSDIISYTSRHMPKFNSISISGYHIQEAGATRRPGTGLYDRGRNRICARRRCRRPRHRQVRAPAVLLLERRDEFLHGGRQAARGASALGGAHPEEFRAKGPASLSLRAHCQTSGWSLTAQDPYNNIIRTMIEAMAATQGHTQSLHTNSFDEALALPTDHSARIARNTQLILQKESGTTRIIDPWGGSAFVERLTHDLAIRAMQHIEEVESLGGMAAAIEKGIPKMRIEEAAARTQARIDSGAAADDRRQRIPAGTGYRGRRIEGRQCRGPCPPAVQIAATERHARCRAVESALDALTQGGRRRRQSAGVRNPRCPRQGDGWRDFARAREGVRPPCRRGAHNFRRLPQGDRGQSGRRTRSGEGRRLRKKDGAKPRILVAKMGQDGHDRGQKVIATAFADLGFDVTVGAMFQTPEEIAQVAVEHDVHIVGASSLAAGHLTLIPELKDALKKLGRDEIVIVAGGVIPPQDYDERAGGRRQRNIPARYSHSGSRGAAGGWVVGQRGAISRFSWWRKAEGSRFGIVGMQLACRHSPVIPSVITWRLKP